MRRSAPPGRFNRSTSHGWRNQPFRRTRRGTRASFEKADCRSPPARTSDRFGSSSTSGGVTFPEPDVTNCGGVPPFIKIPHRAEAFTLPVTSHGAHDVTVHLLAACPNRSYLEAHGFGLEHYVAEPLQIADGYAIAPRRPGHGVEFDWRSLERIKA